MASESEQEKRETLADIVSEIRAYGDRPPPKRAWLDIAERIEAIDSSDAWRSLYTPGNSAAMREALEMIAKVSLPPIRIHVSSPGNGVIIHEPEPESEWLAMLRKCVKRANAALRKEDEA